MKMSNKCGLNGPLSKNITDDELYNYFIKNIYYGNLKINGMNIKVFTTPFEDNRMQGFFHLTTKTQKNFGLKIRMKETRAYFINYIVTMINNYQKCSTCDDLKCKKIKIWTAPYKNTKRTKLLFNDELYSYIIILEKIKNDMYIISSYLIDEPGYLNKVLQEYEKYRKTS
jgi:hypothetical protein